MGTIHLGIIEDESLVLSNLRAYFEQIPTIELVLEAGSVEDFIARVNHNIVLDVLLLDIGLPGMSGLEGIRLLKELKPGVDIIMLTSYEDGDKVFKALCAGADAYLLKKTPLNTIRESIEVVHGGGSFMSPVIARKVFDYFAPKKEKSPDQVLTPRQEQIVQGLVDGLSYKQIADKYLVTVETVRDHIKKIYKKLEVNSKAEVIRKKLDGEI
ncbi:MAG TPA: response regulator transcription factor [Saprospiraceae bacterium]|nr:response regulator transcription factor [Saprospiraceae bacterium]HMQ84018.1 response regulator transcription factor [Saprospiraceae bacterium]